MTKSRSIASESSVRGGSDEERLSATLPAQKELNVPVFSADYLRHLNVKLFETVGVPRDVAEAVSNCTVENCLYGHDSHGMALIPRFVKDLESGKIKPEAKTETVKKSASIALLDAHRGFGQLAITDAMYTAMELAEDTGVSTVTLTNCNHVGIMWTFAKIPAEKGMIGLIWCVSGPEGGGGLVAPYGGKSRAIGANPIGVGIPAGQMKPLILDISTSATAGGKVRLYAQQGRELAPGWALDEEGNPTTDPNEVLKAGKLVGTLLPMAGYKGFGLGLVAEILGGILTGYGASHRTDYREGQGVLIIVIDIKQFVPLDEFERQADALFRHVKAVPTNAEANEVLIPGELEYKIRQQRERNGIPVTEPLWADITAIAERLGVGL